MPRLLLLIAIANGSGGQVNGRRARESQRYRNVSAIFALLSCTVILYAVDGFAAATILHLHAPNEFILIAG